MEWTDIGIVLGARRHGETSAVVELMTREHGRHLGLVRGGAGSRHAPVLQAGNLVSATWRARLDEHLGNYAIEGLDLRAASYLSVAHALYGLNHLAALCRLLPERDPHRPVFDLWSTPSRSRPSCRRGGAWWPVRAGAAGGARLRPRSLDLRRHRNHRRSGLRVAQERRACRATAGGTVARQSSWPCRVSSAPPTPARRRLRAAGRLCTHGLFLARHVYEPRGEPLPEARTIHRRGGADAGPWLPTVAKS